MYTIKHGNCPADIDGPIFRYHAGIRIGAPGLFLQIVFGKAFITRRALHGIIFISVCKDRI